MEKNLIMRRNVDDGQKGSIMRRKFFCVKRFLLGEGHSILRSFQKNVLLGKEPSIMRRKFLQDREFC